MSSSRGAAPRRGLRTLLLVAMTTVAAYNLGRLAGEQSAAAAAASAAGLAASSGVGRASGSVGSARRVTAEVVVAQQQAAVFSVPDHVASGNESSKCGNSGSGSSSSGGVAGSAGAGGGANQQQQQGQRQVDFDYDPVQHPSGPAAAKDTPLPLRRPGFKAVQNANQKKYDAMWTGKTTYQKGSCWGCRFVGDVVSKLKFHTVLDAGTGNGGIVRAMRLRGKAAWGIELSQAVLERDAPDLLQAGYVEQGTLTNLPYQDKQFDLVFSSDVLEHIMPGEVDTVVSEMVRVAKRHIVLSISLKSYQNTGLHTLLRPREWWEAKFSQHGARPNRPLVWALQQKETRFTKSDYSKCKMEGNATDGGLYEVCVVQMPWLVGRPGQELRSHRCVTTTNAELEPWMFAFTVE